MAFFKKKEKDSLIESLEYKIEPKEGEKYYIIFVRNKFNREYVRLKKFMEENDIPLTKGIYDVANSVEDGENTLKIFCDQVLKYERGELEEEIDTRTAVTGDLSDFYIIENL